MDGRYYNQAKQLDKQAVMMGVGRLGRDVYNYGSIEIRRKALEIELAHAKLGVDVAKLEVERHDWSEQNESANVDASKGSSIFARTRRRELELGVEEAELGVKRVRIAIDRHEADAEFEEKNRVAKENAAATASRLDVLTGAGMARDRDAIDPAVMKVGAGVGLDAQ